MVILEGEKMVTFPFTFSSITKFFPISSLMNLMKTGRSTLLKSRVICFSLGPFARASFSGGSCAEKRKRGKRRERMIRKIEKRRKADRRLFIPRSYSGSPDQLFLRFARFAGALL